VTHYARSFLFVPGNRPSLIESALRSKAEAIVFDLEDSVPPEQKSAARDAVRSIVGRPRTHGPPLFVRINLPGSSDARDDLDSLATLRFAGFVVPKVEATADVDSVVEDAEGTPLVLLLETPRGVLRALDLAEAAGSSLAALAFGAEDYRAAMRVASGDAESLLTFALSMVAAAASAVNVPAIDAPEMQIGDRDRLRTRCEAARTLGFRSKFAIHPAQLPIIHDIFGPSSAEREWAERVTRAYEEAQAEGRGSVRLDDRAIDAATVKHARQILERSRHES
jgi:citrate lyase subunit beta / citryl-CoA lyase